MLVHCTVKDYNSCLSRCVTVYLKKKIYKGIVVHLYWAVP